MGTEQDMEPQPPAPYVEPDPHHFFVLDRHYFMDTPNMKLKQESSASSNGSSQGNTETVEEFMERHLVREQRGKSDLPMKDLRHIIPLLVMHCFGIKEEPGQKKVKGMWTDKPTGWPVEVPYCDPNNAMKGEGKPRKETLMHMFNFLLQTYKGQMGNSSPSTLMPVEKVSPSYTTSSPGYSLPAAAEQTLVLPGLPNSSSPVSSSITPSSPNSHTILVETTPMEVTHSTDIQMANPGVAILERIDQKVQYIWQKKLVDDADVALLRIIQDLLEKMSALKDKEVVLFYTSTHEFECTLDLVIELQHMPNEYRAKWKEFEEMWKPSLGSNAGKMQIYNLQGMPEVAEEVEIQQGDESRDQLATLMPSSSSAVTYVTESSINQLGIHTLTLGTIDDLQANGKLEVRVLSESVSQGLVVGEIKAVTPKPLEVVHEEVIESGNLGIEGGSRMIELNDGQMNVGTEEHEEGLSGENISQIIEKAYLENKAQQERSTADLVSQSLEVAVPGGIEPAGQLNEAHITDAVRSMNLKSPPRERREKVMENAIVLPIDPSSFASQSQAQQIYEPISPATEPARVFPPCPVNNPNTGLTKPGNTVGELSQEADNTEVEPNTTSSALGFLEGRSSSPDSASDQICSPQAESFEEVKTATDASVTANAIPYKNLGERPQLPPENATMSENTPKLETSVQAFDGRGAPDGSPPVLISLDVPQMLAILRDPSHPGHDVVEGIMAKTPQLQALLSNLIVTTNLEIKSNFPETGASVDPNVQLSETDIPTVVGDMETEDKDNMPSRKRKRKR